MSKLTMPPGCIDVTKKMRGTVIAIIGYSGKQISAQKSVLQEKEIPDRDSPRHDGELTDD